MYIGEIENMRIITCFQKRISDGQSYPPGSSATGINPVLSSFMIRLSRAYLKASINLLEKDHPHKLMGKGQP